MAGQGGGARFTPRSHSYDLILVGGVRILNMRYDMSDHYYVKKALRHIDYVPIVNSEEEVRHANKTGEDCCCCLIC